jgi:hypothetical protein
LSRLCFFGGFGDVTALLVGCFVTGGSSSKFVSCMCGFVWFLFVIVSLFVLFLFLSVEMSMSQT